MTPVSRFLKSFLLSALVAGACASTARLLAADWPIVHRVGDQLFEGDKPFRFLGLDAPNLHQNESQIRPDFSNRFPDDYEIRDVLDSLHRVGARATRTFSLSIAHPDDGGVPCYITGRRTYNEEAFRALDRAIALAHEYDVRLIIPIIASQTFWGWRGADEFGFLAGKPAGSFWTDPELKADFRHLVDFVLNRRNTVSGILYKDDPAILAWQLGNEFDVYINDRKLDRATWAPPITAWSHEMAAYLKQVDPKHLVAEAGANRDEYLDDPNIDLMSVHLYEFWNRLGGQSTDLAALARAERAKCRGRKALMIDEFGLAVVETNRALMKEIREDGIVGGLLWGIRGHRRDGGFYYHNEGGTPINSYHVPGFGAGYPYEERRTLDLLRAEAFAIRGEPVPPIAAPSQAPQLFQAGNGFTWRGSTGAAGYTLERASSRKGPWQVIASSLPDSVVIDVATYEGSKASDPVVLFHDETAPAGQPLYYRIKGVNAGGETPYSDVLAVAAK